jgi:uncharacterized protein
MTGTESQMPLPKSPVRAVIFTRYPIAGQAKTRLIPAIGGDNAARVHQMLTERTVAVLKQCDCQLEVSITGADEQAFANWLGNDINFVTQPSGGLTERLLAAAEPAPVIFFGSDTPDLRAAHVNAALAALQSHDAVIGPAHDGGYYLIGIRAPAPFLFTDMPWSTDQVLPETLRRLSQHNMTVYLTETLSDCDTPEDLEKWPWLTQISA